MTSDLGVSAWREKIQALLDALEDDERVTVVHLERGEPITEDEIAAVHETVGFELDARFLDFFRATNGLELMWVASTAETADDPITHYLQVHDSGLLCGRINVPALGDLVEAPGYLFGTDYCEPMEYTAEALGGWDLHALLHAFRSLDDFQARPNDSSFYLPGLVLSERYPDPPVLLTEDYVACVDGSHPLLARQYLELVVATAGEPEIRRACFGYEGGVSKNHALLLVASGGLDDVPAPHALLDVYFTETGRSEIEKLVTHAGLAVENTPYAHYNQPPAGPAKRASDDPMAGMRTQDSGGKPFEYVRGHKLDRLILPRFDQTHYTIKNRVADVAALSELIGQPIKVEGSGFGQPLVGCLVGVQDDLFVVAFMTETVSGESQCSFSESAAVGRAFLLVE